jgi:hypothetical protein
MAWLAAAAWHGHNNLALVAQAGPNIEVTPLGITAAFVSISVSAFGALVWLLKRGADRDDANTKNQAATASAMQANALAMQSNADAINRLTDKLSRTTDIVRASSKATLPGE